MYTVQACWEVPLQRRDVDQDQQENLLPFTISRSLKLSFIMNSKWFYYFIIIISWINIDQSHHKTGTEKSETRVDSCLLSNTDIPRSNLSTADFLKLCY